MLKKIKKVFQKKATKKNSNKIDIEYGYDPTFLFLINYPYANYVDFEEIQQ